MPALKEKKTMDLYPLRVIRNEKDYNKALKSMESVFDETKGPFAEYAETLAILIEYYEENHFPMKNASGLDALKFLMEQNDLKQKDLVGVLGGKSTVSEIFSEKRPLNLRHIRILADEFHVKPATFI
jgi:HTH-type transcriptional regulator / antitoxin HigA